MAKLKTHEDITILREGGKRLARVLRRLGEVVAPGVETSKLNELALIYIKEEGGEPSLVGYQPSFAERPYPAAVCVSVNNEVVHGIPNENSRTLLEGDIVGLDIVMTYKGLMVDTAATFPVGKVDEEAQKLIDATREALTAGIKKAVVGNRMGDIGFAIESVALKHGLSAVYELGGHGVGHAVHEEPMVPNVGDAGTGMKLEEGMVLALEPIFNEGEAEVDLGRDGYTYVTADGKRSAHFEHTIVITKSGPEILTVE